MEGNKKFMVSAVLGAGSVWAAQVRCAQGAQGTKQELTRRPAGGFAHSCPRQLLCLKQREGG